MRTADGEELAIGVFVDDIIGSATSKKVREAFVKDLSNEFNVDDRGDLETVISMPFHTRWVFDCEMIGRFSALRRSRVRGGVRKWGKVDDGDMSGSIYEYPLHRWEDVGESKVKSSDVIKMAWGLMQVRRRYFWRRWPEDRL